MSKKIIQDTAGKKGASKLSSVFSNLTPNIHLLHLSTLRQLNNKRAGTASTKTKSEVRGGGAKPWVQKGTGRARAGSIRSPLWVGGGICFGPKPRTFRINIPKKARNLALAQAIAVKEDDIVLIDKLPEIKNSKTNNFLKSLETLNLIQSGKNLILFICDPMELNYKEVRRASNNLPYVCVKDELYVGVLDIVKSNSIVLTKSALAKLEKRLSNTRKKKKDAA